MRPLNAYDAVTLARLDGPSWAYEAYSPEYYSLNRLLYRGLVDAREIEPGRWEWTINARGRLALRIWRAYTAGIGAAP